MKILYYNCNGKRVSIGVAGDHQMTDKRLRTGVSVTKSVCYKESVVSDASSTSSGVQRCVLRSRTPKEKRKKRHKPKKSSEVVGLTLDKWEQRKNI